METPLSLEVPSEFVEVVDEETGATSEKFFFYGSLQDDVTTNPKFTFNDNLGRSVLELEILVGEGLMNISNYYMGVNTLS